MVVPICILKLTRSKAKDYDVGAIMPTKTVTIEEAASHLLELLALVKKGDEVIIAKRKKPLAKLIAFPRPEDNEVRTPRVFGQRRGEVWMSDDFDEPLPDDFWLGSHT